MTVTPDCIESISAVSKVSARKGEIVNRKTFSFNIRLSGSIRYNFSNKTLVVNEGEMIFIPAGSNYTYCVESSCDSACTIINMTGNFRNGSEPKVYSLKDVSCAEYIMNYFPDSWNFGNTADKYKCMSHLFELMAYIDNYDNLKYMEKRKFKIIDPAITYLKNHIYDTALKSDELANICGVSNTYFRKIFISRFGTGPKNYIIEKRMARAKAIIDSGEFESVKSLALSVGYDDPLYFGKVFKNHFGLPPATMNNGGIYENN